MSHLKNMSKLLGDGVNSAEAMALRDQVNTLSKNITIEAQRIINIVMPEKIVNLNDALKNTPEYNLKDMEKLKQMNFYLPLLNDFKQADAKVLQTPKNKKKEKLKMSLQPLKQIMKVHKKSFMIRLYHQMKLLLNF